MLVVGLYFLLSPGYYRDLSEVTQVAPNWTKEMVIFYEKEHFRNTRYEWEESEKFNILKFEPISESWGAYGSLRRQVRQDPTRSQTKSSGS